MLRVETSAFLGLLVPLLVLAVTASAGPVSAQDVLEEIGAEGATVAIITPNQNVRSDSTFVTLTTGGVVFVRGQRFVVTNEPPPAAVLTEAPPPPPADVLGPTDTNVTGATWVPGHWTHGADGFVWAEGQHVAPKPGHVFVPPRWVVVQGRHLFFDGFFVPHRVWVRSFFNTFHFSGTPARNNRASAPDRGPYWPIGVSGRSVGTSATRGRGPYWPLGLGPPTVLNRTGGSPVGLPSNNARR